MSKHSIPSLLCCVLFAACGPRQAKEVEGPTPEPEDSVQVGYGVQPKRNVTGAVASMSAEEAGKQKHATVADMMEGRFAGVEVLRLPGGLVSIRIRGQRSFMGGNEPLYVIDGVPASTGPGGGLDINPDDIKSIEILKDAGATAAYGSRGANGVILITTKRAR